MAPPEEILAPPAPPVDLPFVPPIPNAPPAFGLPTDCLPGSNVIAFLNGKTVLDMLEVANIVYKGADGSYRWTFGKAGMDYAAQLSEPWRTLVSAATRLGVGGANIIELALAGIQRAAKAGSMCGTEDVGVAVLVQSLIGVIKRWVADIPPELTRPWDYYTNWACPVGLPGSEWANEALAHNRITDTQWSCLVRANGDKAEWQRLDSAMRQSRLSDDDILLLKRKGIIDDQQFADGMAWNGWPDPLILARWLQAKEWVASPSDAIEWMLKDVADPQIQTTFGLGQEFNLKYSGVVKDVFDANGMSKENANAMWRAHWRNMSPTALYEMHKRLRPGRFAQMSDADALLFAQSITPRKPVGPGADQEIESRKELWGDIPHWLEDITNGAKAKAYLNHLATTGFHLYEALGQADYPPFWRDRLMAISYEVLTRVDMRRAYETGVISDAELVTLLQDRGYTPVDANRLASFFRKAQIQLSSRRPAANQWVSQGYSLDLLRQALIDTGMREDQWVDVFKILDTRRKIYVQQTCLAAWKKDYGRRLYTDSDMYVRLNDAGLNHDEALKLIDAWKCEYKAPHKQIAARQLCDAAKKEEITRDQLREGLRDLKYRPSDIKRLIGSCLGPNKPENGEEKPAPA